MLAHGLPLRRFIAKPLFPIGHHQLVQLACDLCPNWWLAVRGSSNVLNDLPVPIHRGFDLWRDTFTPSGTASRDLRSRRRYVAARASALPRGRFFKDCCWTSLRRRHSRLPDCFINFQRQRSLSRGHTDDSKPAPSQSPDSVRLEIERQIRGPGERDPLCLPVRIGSNGYPAGNNLRPHDAAPQICKQSIPCIVEALSFHVGPGVVARPIRGPIRRDDAAVEPSELFVLERHFGASNRINRTRITPPQHGFSQLEWTVVGLRRTVCNR